MTTHQSQLKLPEKSWSWEFSVDWKSRGEKSEGTSMTEVCLASLSEYSKDNSHEPQNNTDHHGYREHSALTSHGH